MYRAIISACAALTLVGGLSTPAHAAVTERLKQETLGSNKCGDANWTRINSWVDLDDKGTGSNDDDKIAYDANGPGAIGDLRVELGDHWDVYDIAVEIRKLKVDGSGYTVHYTAGRSFGSAGPNEDFEFAVVSDINRSRKPFLWVKVSWDDGSCVSKTAYFDNWVP